MRAFHSTLIGLCVAAVFLAVSTTISAAVRAKANNSDALNLASSWTNNAAPGTADVAQFDSVVTTPLTLALGADLSWNQVSFINPGGDIVISAGNRLTLSNNTPMTFGAGIANLTLDCDLFCAGALFAILPSAPANRTVTYGGAIQGRNAMVTLGNSPGTLRLGSALSTQIGSPVQIGVAGLKVGIGASSVGNPIVSGPLGTNLVTWNSGSGTTELFAYNGDQVLGNPVRILNSPLVFNSADDLSFSGLVDLNNGNRTLNVTSNGVLRFTGTISNATGMTKTGSGVVELGGTNMANWNNGLAIFGGTARLLTNNVIPDGGTAGTVRMTNTAQLLDLNGFSDTIRGLSGAGGFGHWMGTLDNTAAGTTSVLTLGDDFTYLVGGMIQNSGVGSKLALVKVGAGALVLTNSKTFSGGITNASASEIYINSPGAAGTGPLVLARANAQLSYSGGGSLTWTNDIILSADGVISAADGNTLEVGGIISGPGAVIQTNSLFRQGTLNFSGDNTFTGGFVLFGGSLVLSHPRALGFGLLTIGNASFTGGSIIILAGTNLSEANALTNAVLVNRDFTVGGTNLIDFAGPMVWITNATQRSINVTNPAGAVISGTVSGYGFNKTGAGLLTFNGVCSHNGPSTISTGPVAIGPDGRFTGETTILIGGSGRLDVTAATGFTVATNQTLRGSGTVIGDVIVNGTFSPGDVLGTLSFSNNLTMGADSITTLRVSRSFQTTEKVVCQGSLTYGGSLVVSNVGAPLVAGDTFELFVFTSASGMFASLTLPALDPGLAWNTANLTVNGTISVVSAITGPQITNPARVDSTNLVMNATGGTSNGQFRVLSHTNLAVPIANWEIVSTNTYDSAGSRVITNRINAGETQRFFVIIQP